MIILMIVGALEGVWLEGCAEDSMIRKWEFDLPDFRRAVKCISFDNVIRILTLI